MAFIGLRKPYIGEMNDDSTYKEPFEFGKAINLDITPNFAEGSLYANDEMDEYDKEFTNADVTLGTNTIPIEAMETMFGHKVSGEAAKKSVVYNRDDQSRYVGMGFIGVEKVNKKRSFVAAFLAKVKFTEPSESYETKGENITYKTPSISGKAIAKEDGTWKETEICASQSEAIAWIKGKFGVPATPESGETA